MWFKDFSCRLNDVYLYLFAFILLTGFKLILWNSTKKFPSAIYAKPVAESL